MVVHFDEKLTRWLVLVLGMGVCPISQLLLSSIITIQGVTNKSCGGIVSTLSSLTRGLGFESPKVRSHLC